MTYYSFDLEIDPVTLILKVDPDMVMIPKMKFLAIAVQKPDTHTHAHAYGLK